MSTLWWNSIIIIMWRCRFKIFSLLFLCEILFHLKLSKVSLQKAINIKNKMKMEEKVLRNYGWVWGREHYMPEMFSVDRCPYSFTLMIH